MQIRELKIKNFRGIEEAEFKFDGHTLLVGNNNVGKSTIFEAIDLALGTDRLSRFPVVDEYDFYNAKYLDDQGKPIEIRIDVLLTDVTDQIARSCSDRIVFWSVAGRRLLDQGEIASVDDSDIKKSLRITLVAWYEEEDDEFRASTYYTDEYDPNDRDSGKVSRLVRRKFGFLYLRTLRTGSRALSLERGSLLDIIIRIQSLQTGIWEQLRERLLTLDPPIEDGVPSLIPVLESIRERLSEYIPIDSSGDSTRLFVSQLTREHLRRTISLFLSTSKDQQPIPFHHAGTGTLNTLVLALLSFIAELKEENVIFAMEEPEIAIPPHTQRRISEYLITKTTQCFVTSHSPYVIESFNPDQIQILRRSDTGSVAGKSVSLTLGVKNKTYRRYLRRSFAEAMLANAVIVVEGYSDVVALQAVASKMEASDPTIYPFDLSGVTIVTPDGDGGIEEFGCFFSSLNIKSFAFLDNKNRTKEELEAYTSSGFFDTLQIPYSGMEDLLINEISADIQWKFLEEVGRAKGARNIPSARPTDDEVRKITRAVLVDKKGLGFTSDLIDLCEAKELPQSIKSFLDMVYSEFPRPSRPSSPPPPPTTPPPPPPPTMPPSPSQIGPANAAGAQISPAPLPVSAATTNSGVHAATNAMPQGSTSVPVFPTSKSTPPPRRPSK